VEISLPLPTEDGLTPDLLRRMIAARVQEEAFGTLDRATLKLLDGLARREGARTAERRRRACPARSSVDAFMAQVDALFAEPCLNR
jgi:hypothetical protein